MGGVTNDEPKVIGKDEETGVEDILINPTPKGMTEEEAAALLGQDIREEFYAIAQELEKFHGIFSQLWEMGLPRLTFDLPTAAVAFDHQGRNVEFLFNPQFWKDTDRYTKCFVICHEALHVILSHGIRARDCPMPALANKALDVVVNHTLTSKFGFDRSSVHVGTYPDSEEVDKELRGEPIELCWLDTVFPGMEDQVERDKPFEYYYHILEKNTKFIDGKWKIKSGGSKGGQGGSSSGKGGQSSGNGEGDEEYQDMTGSVLDKHDQLEEFEDSKAKEEITDKLDEALDSDEKQDLFDKLSNTEEGDAAQKAAEKAEKENAEAKDGNGNNPGGKNRGTIAGRLQYRANVHQKIKTKRKWETVIKKWSRKYKEDERDSEQWARTNRRYAALGSHLLLPTEVADEHKSETRIDVWFFQDTSGSCYGFRDRFFAAAKSLPQDRFNIHLYCFDTQVYATSLESGKLYGFGGTSFDILENHIQNQLRQGAIKKYPEAVFVITDGYGNNVRPERPKNWYWFLSTDCTHCIPNECNIFSLSEYE